LYANSTTLESPHHFPDTDGDRLIEIEAIDGVPVFLGCQQQTKQTHEQRVRSLEIQQLGGAPRH